MLRIEGSTWEGIPDNRTNISRDAEDRDEDDVG